MGSENHTELLSWDSFANSCSLQTIMGKSVRDYAFAAVPDYIKSRDRQTLISTEKKMHETPNLKNQNASLVTFSARLNEGIRLIKWIF